MEKTSEEKHFNNITKPLRLGALGDPGEINKTFNFKEVEWFKRVLSRKTISSFKAGDFSRGLKKYIETHIPLIREDKRVKDVFLMLKKESRLLEAFDYVYVIDKKDNLVGVLSFKDIFNNSENTPVEKIMRTALIKASLKMDAEEIVHLALRSDLKSIPIVESGKLLGVIPSKKIISILNKSLREDILHFAGIHKSHLEYENSFTVPFVKSINHRLPWLILGLIGIVFIAMFIEAFEKTLQKYIILAFFIPAIVFISDALGTQHQTLFVRDLAIMGKELNLKKYFLKQTAIAFVIAIIIGIIMFLGISLLWKQPFTAFVISLATFISLIFTSFTALIIIVLIKKIGLDPALGSGPLATIISDATSIIIYFATATILL